MTDPGLAPPGCESFYVLAPVPHLGAAPIDWEHDGGGVRERILAALETVLPGLRQRIVVKRVFTPVDFRDQLNAFQGSAFSVAPAWPRAPTSVPTTATRRSRGSTSSAPGRIPGAGVPGVINSAKATTRLLLDDLGWQQTAAAS